MILTKDELLREKILTGADKLFQRYGLAKTTMEEIAREAGKGKSTLYYYFKSKEEIFEAIIQREKETFFEVIQNEIAHERTATDKFRVFLNVRFQKIRKVVNLYSVLISETRESLTTSGQMCYNWRKKYDEKETNILKSILQYGIATGEFRSLSDEELDKLAFVFTSAQRGIEMDLIMYNQLEDFDNMLRLLLDLALNGLKKDPELVELHA
jgi:AcrR family transcriptional regulator